MEEKEIFRKILKKQMADGPMKEQLQALKIRPTYGNGILFQMVKRAAEGDLSAAKYVLGVVQEEETVPDMGMDFSQLSTEALRRMVAEGG